MMRDKLGRLWVKAFIGGTWKAAFRERGNGDDQWRFVKTPEDTWIADPFLYEVAGEHYLFAELYERKKEKATIAYYKFVDGTPVFQQIIIDQPYHMSYPCVFEHSGMHYMIPETSANASVDLYRATVFPQKWEKVKTLLSGTRYVDTTVVKYAGEYRAISYRKSPRGWMLDIFALDMENYTMKLQHSVPYTRNVGRPAGGFLNDNALIRPAQNCANKYGENLILYQVSQCTDAVYQEHEQQRILACDLRLPSKADRIHTYNRDSLYECVDAYQEHFDLLHGAKTLWRAYLRRWLENIKSTYREV